MKLIRNFARFNTWAGIGTMLGLGNAYLLGWIETPMPALIGVAMFLIGFAAWILADVACELAGVFR